MAVVPFSHLLPKPLPPPLPRVALYHSSRSGHRLFRIPSPSPSPPLLSLSRTRRLRCSSSIQDNSGASETVEEEEETKEDDGVKKEASVAEEIKEMMAARKKEESSGDLWGGVAEEIREIEWPVFGKVLGTTGVVLAVIAGSSVALLTVNAVLAEISDRVFAGKGLQDFFG